MSDGGNGMTGHFDKNAHMSAADETFFRTFLNENQENVMQKARFAKLITKQLPLSGSNDLSVRNITLSATKTCYYGAWILYQ